MSSVYSERNVPFTFKRKFKEYIDMYSESKAKFLEINYSSNFKNEEFKLTRTACTKYNKTFAY